MSVSALGSSALRIGGSLLCGAGLGARVFVVLALAGCLTPGWALAGGIPTLETVVVGGGSEEGLIGLAGAATEGTVSARQLEHRPLLRPAEVLELIPGLIVSQHSGDGKANQYFLRGFNLDHGSDFGTHVMGMPVNMASHAHGQGYMDLNFLMPELVQGIAYRKGVYAAEDGDFATTGSARIDYRRRLEHPFAQVGLGQNGYRRLLAAGSQALGEDGDGRQLLVATELMGYDGPWAQPENLQRRNLLLRLSDGSARHGYAITAMRYSADWTATEHVPQRAIQSAQSQVEARNAELIEANRHLQAEIEERIRAAEPPAVDGLPPAQGELLRRCLARRPEDRFADADTGLGGGANVLAQRQHNPARLAGRFIERRLAVVFAAGGIQQMAARQMALAAPKGHEPAQRAHVGRGEAIAGVGFAQQAVQQIQRVVVTADGQQRPGQAGAARVGHHIHLGQGVARNAHRGVDGPPPFGHVEAPQHRGAAGGRGGGRCRRRRCGGGPGAIVPA